MNAIEEITKRFNDANNSRDGRNISINDVQQFEIDILNITDGYRKNPNDLSRKKEFEKENFDFSGLVNDIKNQVGNNQRSIEQGKQERQETPEFYFAVDRGNTYATQYSRGNEVTLSEDKKLENKKVENNNVDMDLFMNQESDFNLNSNANVNTNIRVTNIKSNEQNYTVQDIEGDYQTPREKSTIDNSVHLIDMGEPIKNNNEDIDR